MRESHSLGLYDQDKYGRTPLSQAEEQASAPRHKYLFAADRWKSTFEVLGEANGDLAEGEATNTSAITFNG